MLHLLDEVSQQIEGVFCSDVTTNELSCPKPVFWQGVEVLSNCYLKVASLMFPCINFGSYGPGQETLCNWSSH